MLIHSSELEVGGSGEEMEVKHYAGCVGRSHCTNTNGTIRCIRALRKDE